MMGINSRDFENLASVATIFALIGTILLFILVIPEKRRATLNNFFKKIADICNFKQLIIEKILKFLYTLLSLYIIVLGFLVMITDPGNGEPLLSGLFMMILGPIIIRIAYELIMMSVLLVKNVIDINKKLTNDSTKEVETPKQAPVTVTPVAETKSDVCYCPNCGTAIDSQDAEFCGNCGQKLR